MAKGKDIFFKCQGCQKDLIRIVIRSDDLSPKTMKVNCSCGDYDEQDFVGDFAWFPLAPVVYIDEEDGFITVNTV